VASIAEASAADSRPYQGETAQGKPKGVPIAVRFAHADQRLEVGTRAIRHAAERREVTGNRP
jgi:hypothetical protein